MRSRSSVFHRTREVTLVSAAVALMAIGFFSFSAQSYEESDAGLSNGYGHQGDAGVGADELEGPVRPEKVEKKKDGRDFPQKPLALVLPTRTDPRAGEDAAAFDVLIANAIQEAGFEVIENSSVMGRFHKDAGDDELEEARELYLDMKLEESYEAAAAVREQHMAHGGDLFDSDEFTNAELFMVQLLLDQGKVEQSIDQALEILLRRPTFRLDPAEYSPAMQALWLAAKERLSGRVPDEPEEEDLKRVGRDAGVQLVATALRKESADGKSWLVVVIASTDEGGMVTRHSALLGERSFWATDVRGIVEKRFPPPKVEIPEIPPISGGEKNGDGQVDEATPWYKTWWFWTAVGVVVVGGTTAGIVGYHSSKNKDPETTMDPW